MWPEEQNPINDADELPLVNPTQTSYNNADMMTAYTGTVPEYADRETKPTADELELEAYYQTLEGYEPDSKDFVLSEAYEPDLEIQPMIRESLGDDG